jgi:murein DD-endopeptidase MepM/ murein hydrolase activator NlpD
MSSGNRLLKYTEPAALVLFLGVLGYLFFTTAPEKALQAISMSPAATSETKGAPVGDPSTKAEAATPTVAPARPARDDFGRRASAFRVETGRVEEHQTFADLLTEEAGVAYAKAVTLAEKARPTFDVRALQAGKRYRLYREPDGGTARHLVYQRGPVRYVSFALGDSLAVREGRRPVTTVRRTASGTIERSLYEAIDQTGADPSLAQALAKVYAWQIDFFRLRPGDRFRVVYEEKRVGGEAIGVGRILGARFDHRSTPYYGIYLEEENEYFDEDGNSLRKSLLQAPIEFARISSDFQKRRYHPVLEEYRAHNGTDYAAEPGTPVYAVGDGRVTRARQGKYNGKNVKIRHNDTYTTQYLHFRKIADGIEPGERVQQKQVIGYVGETGLATGPHCHYILYKNGEPVDPYEQTLPSAPPVADSLRATYDRVKARLLPKLRPSSEREEQRARRQRAAASLRRVPAVSSAPSLLLEENARPLLPGRLGKGSLERFAGRPL